MSSQTDCTTRSGSRPTALDLTNERALDASPGRRAQNARRRSPLRHSPRLQQPSNDAGPSTTANDLPRPDALMQEADRLAPQLQQSQTSDPPETQSRTEVVPSNSGSAHGEEARAREGTTSEDRQLFDNFTEMYEGNAAGTGATGMARRLVQGLGNLMSPRASQRTPSPETRADDQMATPPRTDIGSPSPAHSRKGALTR
jgi:hypothetical protein